MVKSPPCCVKRCGITEFEVYLLWIVSNYGNCLPSTLLRHQMDGTKSTAISQPNTSRFSGGNSKKSDSIDFVNAGHLGIRIQQQQNTMLWMRVWSQARMRIVVFPCWQP